MARANMSLEKDDFLTVFPSFSETAKCESFSVFSGFVANAAFPWS
jgi:hypothetical protein